MMSRMMNDKRYHSTNASRQCWLMPTSRIRISSAHMVLRHTNDTDSDTIAHPLACTHRREVKWCFGTYRMPSLAIPVLRCRSVSTCEDIVRTITEI